MSIVKYCYHVEINVLFFDMDSYMVSLSLYIIIKKKKEEVRKKLILCHPPLSSMVILDRILLRVII